MSKSKIQPWTLQAAALLAIRQLTPSLRRGQTPAPVSCNDIGEYLREQSPDGRPPASTTLWSALQRLNETGLAERAGEFRHATYQLTPAGRQVADELAMSFMAIARPAREVRHAG